MPNKEVLLLYSYDVYPSGNRLYEHHAAILNEVQGDDQAIHFISGYLCELQFIYDGERLRVVEPRSGKDIADFDLVFFQKWMNLPQQALAAAVHLEVLGREYMSNEVLRQNAMTKLAEMPHLIAAGLPVPKTVVAPLASMKRMFDEGAMPFTLPCIIKDIGGTRGANNYLVLDVEQLTAIETELPDVTFMAQEFVPNDFDYRIAIIGGEIAYVLKRTRKGDTHVNNTSQGGEGEFVSVDQLPEVLLQDALKAAQALGREDFAGVDIIVDPDDRHWILEVNKSPEIQTGFDFAHKSKLLVDYIAKRVGA